MAGPKPSAEAEARGESAARLVPELCMVMGATAAEVEELALGLQAADDWWTRRHFVEVETNAQYSYGLYSYGLYSHGPI